MYTATCGWCKNPFTVEPDGNSAFCDQCLIDMNAQSASAIEHQQRLGRGDRSVMPETEAERRRLKAAIRANLGDSKADCMPMKRRHKP